MKIDKQNFCAAFMTSYSALKANRQKGPNNKILIRRCWKILWLVLSKMFELRIKDAKDRFLVRDD